MQVQSEVGIESTEEECWAKAGKAPVTTKWVGVNKGTSSRPIVGARLAARDFKTKVREFLLAAMPLLESSKDALLPHMRAKKPRVWRRARWERRKLMIIDVKKVHLNGKVLEGKFAVVHLRDGKIWMLNRWLHV